MVRVRGFYVQSVGTSHPRCTASLRGSRAREGAVGSTGKGQNLRPGSWTAQCWLARPHSCRVGARSLDTGDAKPPSPERERQAPPARSPVLRERPGSPHRSCSGGNFFKPAIKRGVAVSSASVDRSCQSHMALVLRSEAPRLVTGSLRSFPNPPLQAAWGRGRLGGVGREPPRAGRAAWPVPAPLRRSRRGPRGAGLGLPPLSQPPGWGGGAPPSRPAPGPGRSICVVSFA